MLRRVLRLSPEPCRYFDEAEVHRLLTQRPSDYLAFIRSELQAIAAERADLELPEKQVFNDPGGGDFRLMPCVVRSRDHARKTIKIVGTNLVQRVVPDQITVGRAFALHPVENFVTHVFEACLLSSARTGACAALAIELLAPRVSRVTIVGAGRVGYYSAFYACALDRVREVVLSDLDLERAALAASLLAQQVPATAFAAQRFDELDGCDVLVLATTSAEPLCRPPGLGAGLIVSLGADTETQRELDPAWARAADIYVDSFDSLRFGDLGAWSAAGLIAPEGLVDLLGLLRNGPRPAPGRQRVFISTGSALLDNLTIGYLLAAAS